MFGIDKKDKKTDIADDWFKLKFTGCGAGLNPAMGSNSAYMMTPGGGMILLECGESVFARMKELTDFKNAKWLTIVVSHTHSDHSGSLGTMVLYSYNVLNRPVAIVVGDRRQKKEVKCLLKGFGVPKEACRVFVYKWLLEGPGGYERYNAAVPDESVFISLQKTNHVPELSCHNITLTPVGLNHISDGNMISWSGDTNAPNDAMMYLARPQAQIFQEVRADESNEHTSLDDIEKYLDKVCDDDVRLKQQYRKRVTLMHFDSEKTMKKAKELGCQIPRLVKK